MNPLLQREISAFPLSIGTSLAFESLFTGRSPSHDPDRVVPNQIILSFINVNTLFRNMQGSIDKEAKLDCTENEYAEILEMELDTIQSLFKVEGGDIIKPIFYTIEYNRARSKAKSKIVDMREDTTALQKHDSVILEKTLKLTEKTLPIQKFKDLVTAPNTTRALMITHVAYDLLAHEKMSKLDLLESHTGKLKSRYDWNTKYSQFGERAMNHLPFLEKLLFVFGDKVLFKPTYLKIRQQVYDISIKRQWTAMTTKAKVDMDLASDIDEPMIAIMLKQL
jgi:predicted heme/steroid binding protein